MGFKTEVKGSLDFEPSIESGDDDQIEKESEKFIPATPQEKILNERETTDKRRLGGGCNETEFINFRDDGSGVFKPRNGEYGGSEEILRLALIIKEKEQPTWWIDFLGLI